MSPELAYVEAVRIEVDGYMVHLKRLSSLLPEEVFTILSGISARVVELRIQCWRSESRRLSGLRVHELDPIIEEIDRQFRVHSRIQAVRDFELNMTRAAPA